MRVFSFVIFSIVFSSTLSTTVFAEEQRDKAWIFWWQEKKETARAGSAAEKQARDDFLKAEFEFRKKMHEERKVLFESYKKLKVERDAASDAIEKNNLEIQTLAISKQIADIDYFVALRNIDTGIFQLKLAHSYFASRQKDRDQYYLEDLRSGQAKIDQAVQEIERLRIRK